MNLFDRRVLRYVEDGWIKMPGAIEMVPDLIKEAHRCFNERLLDWAEPSVYDEFHSLGSHNTHSLSSSCGLEE